MKKIFLIAVALGTLFLPYWYVSRGVPVSTYEKFAEAWVRGYKDEALRLTQGKGAARAVHRYPRVGLVPAAMVEAIHGVGEKVKSFEKVGGGDVAIEAKQTLAFDPPGVTAAIGGAMLMFFHHSVRMRKTSEGWKIVAFKPTFLEMHETRRR